MVESHRKVVGGNWKMNLDLNGAKDLAAAISKGDIRDRNVKVIVFPPFPFIVPVAEILNNSGIAVGAQNCSDKVKGAYTGEVSAPQLKSCGVEYCLVGHSERRQYFNENSALLTEKIKRCFEEGITPVFCIGERLEERKSNNHFKIAETQITEVLNNFSQEETMKMIFAYEPVWAIGTGETASPQQAQEMHDFIRAAIGKLKGSNVADYVPVIYGGSCNGQNAKELFVSRDVDGGLIGGASLKADEFIQIINSF